MPHLLYFFPCALVEDFTFAKISGMSTTEAVNKWSTTDATTADISLDNVTVKNNRSSLHIEYASPSNDEIVRGKDDEKYDHQSWDNPIGLELSDDETDMTWATNIGCWVRSSTHNGGDHASLLQLGYETTSTEVLVNWDGSVSETDKWSWLDRIITLTNKNVDRFKFKLNGAVSGDFYINNLCVFKRSTSNRATFSSSVGSGTTNASGVFDWTNGLAVICKGINRTQTGWRLDIILDPKYYRQSYEQLMAMQTMSPVIHSILKSPYHKVSCVADILKPYLVYGYTKSSNDSGAEELFVEPVIINNINVVHGPRRAGIIECAVDLIKYTGV